MTPLRLYFRSAPAAALFRSLPLWLAACGGGGGGGSGPVAAPTSAEGSYTDPQPYSAAATASLLQGIEAGSVAHGSVAVAQASGATTTLAFTATAGHLNAVDPASGAVGASMFAVAYTLDGADPTTRPVTFFFNGGPGSASVWLHLGSFAPKRLVTGNPVVPADTNRLPLVDNPQTLLDATDLVFVDAVGTGYSQAVAPAKNADFWGVDRDAAVFRDFILRWRTVNHRTASPLYLFGESYGTTRAAVLAAQLEGAGVHLAGVVLQSAILNYGSNCGVVASAHCDAYLPSYAATGAWYRLCTPQPADLGAFIAAVRDDADQRFAPALIAWKQAGTPLTADLSALLSAETGIAPSLWQRRPDLDPDGFRANLIAGTAIGRYDARVSVPAGSALAQGGDPSSSAITPGFTAAIADWLQGGLHYTAATPYVVTGEAYTSWNFDHAGARQPPDTVPDLAIALTLNPQLRILGLAGWHDLATPFHLTGRDLARLGPAAPVTLRAYPGGHMTYLDDASRALEKADLVAFYRGLPIGTAQAGRPGAAAAAGGPDPTIAAEPRGPTAQERTIRLPAVATVPGPHADPWLPPALQSVSPPAETRGAALAAQVEHRLRAQFDAADADHTGRISAAQARAIGLNSLAERMDRMSTDAQGRVGFDDWMNELRRADRR
jgi:carboxypeptidase C (cathepsin A)